MTGVQTCALPIFIEPSFLKIGGFRAGGLDVVVVAKVGLAVGARLLGELIGVCTADTDATGVPKGGQAAGAEGGQGRFIGLVSKITAHNHFLRFVWVSVRYGKSPPPRFKRIPGGGLEVLL